MQPRCTCLAGDSHRFIQVVTQVRKLVPNCKLLEVVVPDLFRNLLEDLFSDTTALYIITGLLQKDILNLAILQQHIFWSTVIKDSYMGIVVVLFSILFSGSIPISIFNIFPLVILSTIIHSFCCKRHCISLLDYSSFCVSETAAGCCNGLVYDFFA